MTIIHKNIGLLSKNNEECLKIAKTIHLWLQERGVNSILEKSLADNLGVNDGYSLDQIGVDADIAIVIGGDGVMLGAARVFCCYPIKLIGINKGKLGFLTDLSVNGFLNSLADLLQGKYSEESRFLLNMQLIRNNEVIEDELAMNEVVFHANQLAHIINFDVYVDGVLMSNQRADGFIIASPTGSTAYSLSAGGAILSPDLDVLILLPMFSHTLSSRPVVISANKEVKLVVTDVDSRRKIVSCDGQNRFDVLNGDVISIKKNVNHLILAHTLNYNYFAVLRHKLHWNL